MNEEKKFPLDYQAFIGLNLLEDFNPSSAVTKKENQIYEILKEIRNQKREIIFEELRKFLTANLQTVTRYEYYLQKFTELTKNFEVGNLAYVFIFVMVISGLVILNKSENDSKKRD